MNDKPVYTIPVNAIKIILCRENVTYFCDVLDWCGNYQYFASRLMKTHIDNLQSYEEIEKFISATRRMTLQEWIDTLR